MSKIKVDTLETVDGSTSIDVENLHLASGAWAYESTDQTPLIATGTLSVSHGLGRKPYDIQVVLKCVTAEDGYAVGDEIIISKDINSSGRTTVWFNSTLVGIAVSISMLSYNSRTTGSSVSGTLANWKVVFRAR